jgi:hypothetical protein
MRTLTLLMIFACIAAGFAYLQYEVRLARQILEVNGLAWEDTTLADDEFRVSVQHRTFREDLALYVARIHTTGAASASITTDRGAQAGIGWNPQPGWEPAGCWVTIMYDKYTESVQPRAKLDVALSRGLQGDFGQHFGSHLLGDAAKASIMPQLKSGVYKRGQPIPLFELNGKKYMLLVK